jgi:hypothetical protein
MRRVYCEVKNRDLVQSFRAMQSVAEAGFVVVVGESEASRWAHAAEWLALPYDVGAASDVLNVEIDHAKPTVVIGEIERPLLFPVGMFDVYRSSWSMRTKRVSFTGYPSRSRRAAIRDWRRRTGRGTTVVHWTKDGRRWPVKAWDQSYVDEMCSSEFALCPDGDYVWTYRFFEAAASGAIPIVESETDLYQGFTYFRMSDGTDALEWTEANVIANYERARAMLTAPRDLLRLQIERLLAI